MSSRPPILDCAATLADGTRCRILQVLERRELTVTELRAVLQLPQSTVSRHLKLLSDGGWVRARRESTSHLYQLIPDQLDPALRQMWKLVRDQLADTPGSRQDRRRLESVLAERQSRSRQFFTTTAGEWDRLRDELYGTRFDLQAVLGLLDSEWTVGDLACGTGRIAETLAPFVARVVAIDGSPAMLEAAHDRLDALPNVEVRSGELESLPLAASELDAAVLFLALHHVPDPARALREAQRTLRPGGRLLVVDTMAHGREAYRQEMGHVWLGFSPETMEQILDNAGFTGARYLPLTADPDAKGPTLFAASARRPHAANVTHGAFEGSRRASDPVYLGASRP